jgi:TolB protein
MRPLCNDFHVSIVEFVGDLFFSATGRIVGEGIDLHPKLSQIIQNDLSPTRAHDNVVVRDDNFTSMQFRSPTRAWTEQLRSRVDRAVDLGIKRIGNRITICVARAGEVASDTALPDMDREQVLQVGLFVCRKIVAVVEVTLFSHVRLKLSFTLESEYV